MGAMISYAKQIASRFLNFLLAFRRLTIMKSMNDKGIEIPVCYNAGRIQGLKIYAEGHYASLC
jgi:hypothetical protein